MIFLVSSEKMIFPFPENMILFFRHKRKDTLSQKNTWKYNIFFNCSEKMVFPKNSRLNRIFIVISGKMVFLFSRKYDIFCLDGKWKNTIVIKKCVELWYFLYSHVGITSVTLSSCKKKRCPCPKKVHLRVIFPASPKKMLLILEIMVFLLKYHIDWHPRKDPRSSQRRCSTRKGVLGNFSKFTGKDLCQSPFFNKAVCLRTATLLGLNFIKREVLAQVFSFDFFEISKNTLFYRKPLGGCFWCSSYSLFFYGDLYRCFYKLQRKKCRKLNI